MPACGRPSERPHAHAGDLMDRERILDAFSDRQPEKVVHRGEHDRQVTATANRDLGVVVDLAAIRFELGQVSCTDLVWGIASWPGSGSVALP